MVTREPSPCFHFLKNYKYTVNKLPFLFLWIMIKTKKIQTCHGQGKGESLCLMIKREKKDLRVKLKCLTAAAALGIALTAVSPTTSAFAKSDEKPKFEFGIVPDVQYWDGDASGTRYYRNSVDKLMEAAQTLNRRCRFHRSNR